jgi:hypothetical protein
MNPFISSFRQNLSAPPAQTNSNKNIEQSTAVAALAVTSNALGANKARYNPFLAAQNSDSAGFKEMYGVNRPLDKPMFLGYRDDQAMYGGSRLFLLY